MTVRRFSIDPLALNQNLAFREEGFYPQAYPEVLKESLKFFLTIVLKPREKHSDQIAL